MSDRQLEGELFYSPKGMNATIRFEKLTKGNMAVVDSFTIYDYVRSIVFHRNNIWVSTMGHYLIMSPDFTILDTVTVYYPGMEKTQWASNTLASDGNYLFGHLPVSYGDSNYSHIHRFNADGIAGTFDIPYQTSGLAFDGTFLWSLSCGKNKLLKFDTLGTIYENLNMNIPDACHLEYSNKQFWTLGYFLTKLYTLNCQGKAVMAYDLPQGNSNFSPGGIAFDGTYFWYAEYWDVGPKKTVIYKLSIPEM